MVKAEGVENNTVFDSLCLHSQTKGEVSLKILKVRKNTVMRRADNSYKHRAREITAFLLAFLVLIGVGRVGYIVAVHGDEYRSKAEANQLYDEIIPAVRGTIYDRNMNPLVTGSSAWILTVDPKEIYNFFSTRFNKKLEDGTVITEKADEKRKEYYSYLSKNLAKILDMKAKEVKEIITQNDKHYARVKKKVDASQRLELDEFLSSAYVYNTRIDKKGNEIEDTVKAQKFFNYENDSIRIYPDNNFASTVIGATNYNGDGISGVEMQYNSVLKGKAGRKVTAKDAYNNAIDSSFETINDPEEGNGVVLTIDSNIQMYLENALRQAKENTQANGVFGIVMDVDTGAVLAMSDKPDFDLNDPYKIIDENEIKILKSYEEDEQYNQMVTDALYSQWNSFCITSTYEPGSTFKIFTAAAALEEGVVNLNTTYTCNGAYRVANDTVIHCAKTTGHGTQTFTQGLMNSCNPFFIDIGQKLGVERYYKYFDAFGFTQKTGIDLTGEATPVYHPLSKMGKVELASTSFGQSVRLSPIQIITATCAIANGGKLMEPYIVDSIVSSEGSVISKTQPTVKRQVVSESTAATVRQMMEAVVEGGTGKNAYIAGYRVAGKTATSEKLDLKTEKGQEKSTQMKYVASFVCFAPADDPQVAILVGVDDPPGEYRGGGVIAAPIARTVMESTLKYLNVKPQYTEAELSQVSYTAPNLISKTVSQAKSTAAGSGFNVRVVGDGDMVVSQVPAAGQTIPKGGVVVIYTENNAKAQVVEVPDFVGMSVSQANQVALAAGINITISGPANEASAQVYTQSVAKGTKVQTGSGITLYFHSTTKVVD